MLEVCLIWTKTDLKVRKYTYFDWHGNIFSGEATSDKSQTQGSEYNTLLLKRPCRRARYEASPVLPLLRGPAIRNNSDQYVILSQSGCPSPPHSPDSTLTTPYPDYFHGHVTPPWQPWIFRLIIIIIIIIMTDGWGLQQWPTSPITIQQNNSSKGNR